MVLSGLRIKLDLKIKLNEKLLLVEIKDNFAVNFLRYFYF